MYIEAVDDDKLKLLAFEDRWHFIAILCCKGQGILDRREGELLQRSVAAKLGLTVRELDEVARRLSEVDLIDRDTFQPLAWNERQFKSDTSADRVRKHRESKQKSECNGDQPLLKRYSNALDTDTESDTESDQKTLSAEKSATPDRFDEFWSAYPKRVKKKQAREKWKRKKYDRIADQILQDIETRKTMDARWLDGFIPDPTTYLNGERWEDEIEKPRNHADKSDQAVESFVNG